MVATLAAPVSAETATSFSGEATGVDALVENPLGGDPLIDLILVRAGPLPPRGGAAADELLDADVDDVLEASVISAETEGSGSTAESSATIADLKLTIAPLLRVTSETIASNAVAECTAEGAEVSGDSVIEDLRINRTAVEVTGDPNQFVDLGPIELVINEQIQTVEPDFGEITVNALRITVKDPLTDEVLGEVILAQSHADVACMNDTSTDGLFSVTSGPTGTSGSPLPLAVLILAGVAVSFVLARSYVRR